MGNFTTFLKGPLQLIINALVVLCILIGLVLVGYICYQKWLHTPRRSRSPLTSSPSLGDALLRLTRLRQLEPVFLAVSAIPFATDLQNVYRPAEIVEGWPTKLSIVMLL